MGGTVRSIVAHATFLAAVVVAGVLTAWDGVSVALVVVVAGALVGGIAGGHLVTRVVATGALVSLAVIAASAIATQGSLDSRLVDAARDQGFTPLWAIPLGGFGVWVGADFRSSLRDMAASGRRPE